MRLPSLALKSRRLFQSSWVLMTLLAMLAAAFALVVNVPQALACPVCIAPDKITLSGDGISGTASITDVMLISSLGAGNFMGFDQPAPVVEPAHTGSGYELTRYFKNSGVPDSFWTTGFDHMRYYPGASGQPGYVYYEGFVSDEASRYAQGFDMPKSGSWYRMTASEDNVIQQLLAAAHTGPSVKGGASSPPLSTSVPPTATQPPAILRVLGSLSLPVALLLACLAVLIAGVGLRLARTRRHLAVFTPTEESAN